MKDRLEHARGLWQKAANDLVAARAIMATGEAFDTVCFHAQQAVEKCLKAVLALHDVEYPRRHDMAELIELVQPLFQEISSYSDRIIGLAPFAVEIRYDMDFVPSLESTKEAVQTATEVYDLIGAIIDAEHS
jgi:HEPN domain-containing protein